jgi:uncharacterized protein with HEPN domain
MSPEQRDPGLLYDIVLAARKALLYTAGVSEARFLEDEMIQDAAIRNIEIIGEAASRVSDETREKIDLPWKKIIGQRHVAIHDYRKLDLDRIWTVIRDELEPLIAAIEGHLATLPSE